MIFAIIVLLFVFIAFAEIGLAALVVLPMTVVMVAGLFSFFAVLGGVEGAGEIFLWCAVITGAFFGALHLIGSGGGR